MHRLAFALEALGAPQRRTVPLRRAGARDPGRARASGGRGAGERRADRGRRGGLQRRSGGDRRGRVRRGGAARGVAGAAAPPLAQRDGVDRAARTTAGFPLARHNVFFSDDYPAEFAALAAGRLADAPSVYVCAQDRDDAGAAPAGAERLQIIVNAPATGDGAPFTPAEIDRCTQRMLAQRFAGGAFARPGGFGGADDAQRFRARCFRRRVEPFMDRPRTGGRPPSAGRAAGRGSLGSTARAGAPTRARASRWRRFPAG